MREVKSPVFQYLGVDGDCHLFKIYFPVVEKSADKFNFILDNGTDAENLVGSYGLILRLRPENLLFYPPEAQYIQMEIKDNTIKSVRDKDEEERAVMRQKEAINMQIARTQMLPMQGFGPR